MVSFYLSDVYDDDFEEFFDKALEIKGITKLQAHIVTLLVEGYLSPEGFPSVLKWIKQCFNMPMYHELVMCACNEVIEGHGIESLGINSDGCPKKGLYINLGDSYDWTLFYSIDDNEYEVCCSADWQEEAENEAN